MSYKTAKSCISPLFPKQELAVHSGVCVNTTYWGQDKECAEKWRVTRHQGAKGLSRREGKIAEPDPIVMTKEALRGNRVRGRKLLERSSFTKENFSLVSYTPACLLILTMRHSESSTYVTLQSDSNIIYPRKKLPCRSGITPVFTNI